MLALHTGKHHIVLQRAPVRLGTEVLNGREIAPEFVARIMGGTAIAAMALAAGHIAQLGDQATDRRKLMAYPGRHHRVTARHPQPRQCIGDGPMQTRVHEVGVQQRLQTGTADLERTGQGRVGFLKQSGYQTAQFSEMSWRLLGNPAEKRPQVAFGC